jgi:hypothetical protein
MTIRGIKPADYERLLEIDRKIYPTDSPVTKELLDMWYKNNPEFGIIFEKNNKMLGMCISIPLTLKAWNSLIRGKISESELNYQAIFNNAKDHFLAIHIYHIEKFDPEIKEFHKLSLKVLSDIIKRLKKKNKKLTIGGFSGLCATSKGIDLFYNKLNCMEGKYICQDHILTKGGKIKILNADSLKEISKFIDKGYSYNNRCKMLIAYPGDPSLVWKYFKV